MLSITKRTDELEVEQNIIEKLFTKKSELKDFLEKEGYCRASKNQFMKIHEGSIYEATFEKIKIK